MSKARPWLRSVLARAAPDGGRYVWQPPGPGATNLVTGLADTFMDSIPLVAITGQVASSHIGTDAFKEMDVIGMSLSCTKHSYLVTDIEELAQH